MPALFNYIILHRVKLLTAGICRFVLRPVPEKPGLCLLDQGSLLIQLFWTNHSNMHLTSVLLLVCSHLVLAMQCKGMPTAGSQALPPPQLQPPPGRHCGEPPPPGPPTLVRPPRTAIAADIPMVIVVLYHHHWGAPVF